MKPIIGITSSHSWDKKNFNLPASYIEAVERGGGTPILLPPTMTIEVEPLLGIVDGVLLTGGVDVDPLQYGEQPLPKLGAVHPWRDRFEIDLTKEALRIGKPILAICRGHQVLNVAAGGTLIQDIASQVENPLKHRQDAPPYHASHTVRVESPSILYEIFGKEELGVNTFHHQAVKDLGKGLKATAWAPDGVNEAFEGVGDAFVLSVQWHPERMIDGEMLKIFERFVEETK